MCTNTDKNGEAGSRYAPGSAYLPEIQALNRSTAAVLELLKEYREEGVTRLEAGPMGLALPARVSDLRVSRYEIETRREDVDGSRIGRYVLLSTTMVK